MATKKVTTTTEVAAEVVKEVKPVEAVEVIAAPAKKAATTEATATKKAPAKKAEAKKETVITVQYQGHEETVASIEEKVKAAFVAEGNKASSIKTMNVYVKPEEFAAYYVINDTHTGRVFLF